MTAVIANSLLSPALFLARSQARIPCATDAPESSADANRTQSSAHGFVITAFAKTVKVVEWDAATSSASQRALFRRHPFLPVRFLHVAHSPHLRLLAGLAAAGA